MSWTGETLVGYEEDEPLDDDLPDRDAGQDTRWWAEEMLEAADW